MVSYVDVNCYLEWPAELAKYVYVWRLFCVRKCGDFMVFNIWIVTVVFVLSVLLLNAVIIAHR